MSRFIQQEADKKAKKKIKEDKKKPLPKPGKYTGIDLEKAAKIYSPIGGKY
jgi:hypothetical protein